ILKSVSRVMHDIVSPAHRTTVQKIRTLMATYEEKVELIQIGAYRHGTDPKIDEAIKYYPIIIDYLKQAIYEKETFEQSIEKLHLISGSENECIMWQYCKRLYKYGSKKKRLLKKKKMNRL